MGFGDVSTKTNAGFGTVVGKKKRRVTGFGKVKPDVTTLEGMLQVSKQEQEEIARKAEKIMAQKKEDPEEIFSGGIISDVFDALNVLQYGVVGTLKGKSFLEGVQKRESFSDEDALGEYGIPGIVGGMVLDIAVDPMTYVGGFGIGKRLFSGLGDVTTVAANAIRKVPAGSQALDFLGSKFVYRFGQDPVYAEMAERTIKNIGIGNSNLIELARPLSKLDPEVQRLFLTKNKQGRLIRKSAEELRKVLTPDQLAAAKPAFDELDKLGKAAVDAGLLKKEIYEANLGQYIANLYRKHEIPPVGVKKVKALWPRKPLRMDLSRFMKSTEIPEEVREAMGEVLEAGYPTAKSLVQLNKAVEQANFFKTVSSRWGKDAAEEGFEKLASTKRLGELADKYVPKFLADDINEVIRPYRRGVESKIVGGFKFGKVILNPATHARNVMSNFILNGFEGLSPHRLDVYGEAAKQMATKGKWYQEAKAIGLGLDTFAAREIRDMLIGPDAQGLAGNVRKAMNKVGNIYQGEEEFAKLAQYIFQRKNGLVPAEAWKVAERATFNYAQVTPFIRRLRESIFGFPFITFTYKATPQIIKTAIQYPTRISNIGKIKNAIENLTPVEQRRKEREVQPDYIKNGLFVRLPNKDKFDRPGYFDLTYILPFGDIVSGQLFEARRPGEPITQTALAKFPAFNVIAEIARNEDFFGNKIIKGDSIEPAEQGKDLFGYLMKFYAPSLMSGPIETLFDEDVAEEVGGRGFLPGRLGRSFEYEEKKKERPLEVERRTTRTVKQELLRAFLGLKVTPFDFERQAAARDKELRERLQRLLIEEGIMAEFTIPFIPKE